MAPPAPATPPAALTSSLGSAFPAALEVAGGGAFEVDGGGEAPDFFLGAMVDGAVEDEDGDEDDAVRTLSGSCKGDPLPGARKMSRDVRGHLWDRVAPCWFGWGTSHCTKSRPTHGSAVESIQAIYPGSGRREA